MVRRIIMLLTIALFAFAAFTIYGCVLVCRAEEALEQAKKIVKGI
jgi:hypothetical protein